ncbi:hypothetical protein [Litchfieldia alkalitelluris]|uniref:hypothetical protein n=1 Tax=Litchfieldia alkalitelluris TaxID=304268 RepID=UPI0009982DF7|nr:hypothetical protein [Litchfieldia alkalitelluris]
MRNPSDIRYEIDQLISELTDSFLKGKEDCTDFSAHENRQLTEEQEETKFVVRRYEKEKQREQDFEKNAKTLAGLGYSLEEIALAMGAKEMYKISRIDSFIREVNAYGERYEE